MNTGQIIAFIIISICGFYPSLKLLWTLINNVEGDFKKLLIFWCFGMLFIPYSYMWIYLNHIPPQIDIKLSDKVIDSIVNKRVDSIKTVMYNTLKDIKP